MKRVSYLMLLVAMGLLLSCSKEDVESPELMWSSAMSEKGVDNDNAELSGVFYNLNIIGVEKGRTAEMTGGSGDQIFVGFEGVTKINLTEGADFDVLDANGTDGEADFKLPNPDLDGNGITDYSIWVRPLEAAENAPISFCATADTARDSATGEDGYYEVCSAELLSVEGTSGSEPLVRDVSVQLLTISIETEISFTGASGDEVTIPAGSYTIFDEIFEDYFWYYGNNGLRILQLRFYEVL